MGMKAIEMNASVLEAQSTPSFVYMADAKRGDNDRREGRERLL